MSKVPVQKGPIDPNPMTMKQESYKQKVQRDIEEQKELRDGQKMTRYPKGSK